MKFVLPILCVLLVLFANGARVRKADQRPTNSDEPKLTPLTDKELALDLQSLMLNQPDFVADSWFFPAKALVDLVVRVVWRARAIAVS